jgi:hypothetical protein
MRQHQTHDAGDFGSASPLERLHADAFYAALLANAHDMRIRLRSRYPGAGLRTRDAIEQSGVVVAGTVVDPGAPAAGLHGERPIDNARFRVEEILTPMSGARRALRETVTLSYVRHAQPGSAPEHAPQAGRRYILFCTLEPQRQMHALKMLPHSPDAARMVASSFESGARHSAAAIRLA